MSDVLRDSAARQLSRDQYRQMTKAAELLFIDEIKRLNLPAIELTTHEYEVGRLPNPKLLEGLINRVSALVIVHHQYELAPTQKINALFDAAMRCGRLVIDGKTKKAGA